MLILILQLSALFLLIIAGLALSWLGFINYVVNSPNLARRWQTKAVPRAKNTPVWGKIFETVTYRPIVGAVIKMYEAETNESISATTSDAEGNFGFEAFNGKFYLRVNAFYHSFPSQPMIERHKPELARRRQESKDYFGLFLPEIHDKNFENLYFGEIINNKERTLQKIFSSRSEILRGIEANAPIMLNIPLDRDEILTLDKKTLEAIITREKILGGLKNICLFFGILAVVASLLIKPNLTSLIILELFFVFALYAIFERLKTKYTGLVTDSRGRPLELALIRARGYMTKRIKASAITDNKGEFLLALHQGFYKIEVSRDHFSSEHRLIQCGGQPKEVNLNFKLERKIP